jgi:hypothetical protein
LSAWTRFKNRIACVPFDALRDLFAASPGVADDTQELAGTGGFGGRPHWPASDPVREYPLGSKLDVWWRFEVPHCADRERE